MGGMFQSLAHRIYLQLFIALALGTALGGRWPLAAEVLQAQQGLVWAAVAGLVVLWWLYRNAPEPWCRLPGFIWAAMDLKRRPSRTSGAASRSIRAASTNVPYRFLLDEPPDCSR